MATSAYNKFNIFEENRAEGVHNLASDTLVFALTTASPVATNTVLANLTQISYTNLSSRTLTGKSSTSAAGVYTFDFADLVLTASGGSVAAFRYLSLYNDTAAGDPLIMWADYGSLLTLADTETLTISPNALGLFTST